MWLRECYRQVEAEVISYSRYKLHQSTYRDHTPLEVKDSIYYEHLYILFDRQPQIYRVT